LSPVALQQGDGQGEQMGKDGILRGIFGAALLAGASFYFVDRLGDAGPLWVVWKGAGVALLAIWCAMQARGRDGWLIAAVMAFGALGDVLLEAVGLSAGAGAFLIGHVVALWLYQFNQRADKSVSQIALAMALVIVTPFIAWALTHQLGVLFYSALLGSMAGSAWVSRFPRYRTGIGAVMFVISDLLIFAKMGPLAGSPVPGLLIWPLYFGGQVLIAWGVVRTLARDAR
jgi:uncharacterized membrane protein YhhN